MRRILFEMWMQIVDGWRDGWNRAAGTSGEVSGPQRPAGIIQPPPDTEETR